ncbi:MAG: putative bifunctional diguanylate cyclase/phosphodiesterase [Halofilum sp. (in: g-proteobacteria)]
MAEYRLRLAPDCSSTVAFIPRSVLIDMQTRTRLEDRVYDLSSHIERDLRLSATAAPDSVEARVQREQTRLFWSQAYLLVGLGGAIGVALVAAQWAVIDHATLLGWFGLLLTVSALWAAAIVIFHRTASRADSHRQWLNGAAIAALVYGLTWSIGAFQLFPAAWFTHQAILTIMFAGLSAGAITVLSSISITGVAFVIPALLPLTYQFALAGTTNARLILGMLLVFLLTLIMANRHLYRTLRENIRLRIEKSLSEAALYESESRYRLMFNQSPLGIVHYDAGGTVLDCNEPLAEILGRPRSTVVGTSMTDDVGDARMATAVRISLRTGWGYYEDTFAANTGRSGTPLRAFFNAIRGPDDECLGGVGIIEDFTQRKRAEEALHREAYYDALTGLPNRRLLADRLEQALRTARRHKRFGALIFLDIDHFKRINDRLGHAAGDRILCRIAERLVNTLRSEDTVARLGGDEFILLLREVSDDEQLAAKGARAVCDKILSVLQESFDTRDGAIRLTASLGITLFPQDDAPPEELLRRSDTAMYSVKRELRGEARFYDRADDHSGHDAAHLEHDLRFALEQNQLLLHYQPIVGKDGAVLGAEALLRWQHPEHGLIPPDRFIPLAEENGLIISIGRWIVVEACKRLREAGPMGAELPVCINVSAQEFHHPGFARHVEETLARTGIDGRRIVFEITESVLIDRVPATIDKMERLRRHGITFTIDDFGTGYSSLTYLKRLPVNTIKIDRSFIRDLESDPTDAAIVEGIIALADRLGLGVVAEGVETADQLALLRDKGCERFQGFYWGRPAPFDEAFGGTNSGASGGPRDPGPG